MLKKIIIACGAVLIGGYLTWSLLGWELASSRRDPVPTARAAGRSSGHSGRGHSYFGGYGFGK